MSRTILFSFLLVFITTTKVYSQLFFEGIIEYEIQYESHDKNISEKILEEQMGHSVTTYVNKQGYVKYYFNRSGDSLYRLIYDAKQGILYTISNNATDTAYSYKTTDTSGYRFISLSDIAPVKITNMECKGIELITKDAYRSDSVMHYCKAYFSPEFKLNPEQYINYKMGKWDLITHKHPFVILKTVNMLQGQFTFTETFKKIKQQKVNTALYDISNYYIKE